MPQLRLPLHITALLLASVPLAIIVMPFVSASEFLYGLARMMFKA